MDSTNDLLALLGNAIAQVRAFVLALPTPFWTYVGGVTTALITVGLTNSGHLKRLEKQLASDEHIKEQQRKFDLKKDIYLAAAEALTVGITAIGRANDHKITPAELMQPFQDRAPALSKLQLVGSEAVIHAAMKAQTKVPLALFAIAPRRYAVASAARALENAESQQGGFAAGSAAAEDHGRIVAELRSAFVLKQFDLVDLSLSEVHRLQQLTVGVVEAMRADLGLAIDIDAFQKVVADQHREIVEGMQAFKTANGIGLPASEAASAPAQKD